MRPRTVALIGIFASHALLGMVAAWTPLFDRDASAASVACLGLIGFFVGYFPFAWVIHDRRERGIPRSTGFNIALAAATGLVAPIHLWRSRPRGQRLWPLLGLVGVAAGTQVGMLVGLGAGLMLVAPTMDFPGL